MIINNRYDQTNFRAKLFVQAYSTDNGINSTIQVFKLTPSDKPFIQRCLNVCQGKDRFLPQNDKNIGVHPTAKEVLKDFFKAFLTDKNGNYYISIRDNKIISGVLQMHKPEIRYKEYFGLRGIVREHIKTYTPKIRIILNNDMSEQNALTIAAIKDMKSEISGLQNTINTTQLSHTENRPDHFTYNTVIDQKKYPQFLRLDSNGSYYKSSYCDKSVAQIEGFIKRKTPQTQYNSKFSDETEYNLAEVLDID